MRGNSSRHHLRHHSITAAGVLFIVAATATAFSPSPPALFHMADCCIEQMCLVAVAGPSLLPQWPIVGCRSHRPLLHHSLPRPLDHCVSVVLRRDGAVIIVIEI